MFQLKKINEIFDKRYENSQPIIPTWWKVCLNNLERIKIIKKMLEQKYFLYRHDILRHKENINSIASNLWHTKEDIEESPVVRELIIIICLIGKLREVKLSLRFCGKFKIIHCNSDLMWTENFAQWPPADENAASAVSA